MTVRAREAIAVTERAPESSGWYRIYVLGFLLVANTFNLFDRLVLSILQESIKKELALSDSELGALTGLGFAIFYAILGIPIARYADRSVRTRVITISLCVWSLMTALCGFAKNFAMLLAFRVGVAVGEAGCTPPAHSIISDYFPKERRVMAQSIYALGGPLGVIIGLAVGGWLNEMIGWRKTFVIVGLPGVLVALVGYFTLREPRRGLSDGLAGHGHAQIPIREVAQLLWRSAPFRNLACGCALIGLVGNAVVSWNPPFYSRVHSLGSADIGMWLGLLYALPLAAGTLLGGALGDRLGRRNARWYLWVPGLAVLIMLPVALAQYNAASVTVSLALSTGPALVLGMYVAPCFGVTQMLVPVSMRASASAVLLLILSLVGVGLGPFVTGVLSDVFHAQGYGHASLGRAISLVIFLFIPAGVFLLRGGSRLADALVASPAAATDRDAAAR